MRVDLIKAGLRVKVAELFTESPLAEQQYQEARRLRALGVVTHALKGSYPAYWVLHDDETLAPYWAGELTECQVPVPKTNQQEPVVIPWEGPPLGGEEP